MHKSARQQRRGYTINKDKGRSADAPQGDVGSNTGTCGEWWRGDARGEDTYGGADTGYRDKGRGKGERSADTSGEEKGGHEEVSRGSTRTARRGEAKQTRDAKARMEG
eukprot:5148615-Pleurochrysis_carterae.AAC.3